MSDSSSNDSFADSVYDESADSENRNTEGNIESFFGDHLLQRIFESESFLNEPQEAEGIRKTTRRGVLKDKEELELVLSVGRLQNMLINEHQPSQHLWLEILTTKFGDGPPDHQECERMLDDAVRAVLLDWFVISDFEEKYMRSDEYAFSPKLLGRHLREVIGRMEFRKLPDLSAFTPYQHKELIDTLKDVFFISATALSRLHGVLWDAEADLNRVLNEIRTENLALDGGIDMDVSRRVHDIRQEIEQAISTIGGLCHTIRNINDKLLREEDVSQYAILDVIRYILDPDALISIESNYRALAPNSSATGDTRVELSKYLKSFQGLCDEIVTENLQVVEVYKFAFETVKAILDGTPLATVALNNPRERIMRDILKNFVTSATSARVFLRGLTEHGQHSVSWTVDGKGEHVAGRVQRLYLLLIYRMDQSLVSHFTSILHRLKVVEGVYRSITDSRINDEIRDDGPMAIAKEIKQNALLTLRIFDLIPHLKDPLAFQRCSEFQALFKQLDVQSSTSANRPVLDLRRRVFRRHIQVEQLTTENPNAIFQKDIGMLSMPLEQLMASQLEALICNYEYMYLRIKLDLVYSFASAILASLPFTPEIQSSINLTSEVVSNTVLKAIQDAVAGIPNYHALHSFYSNFGHTEPSVLLKDLYAWHRIIDFLSALEKVYMNAQKQDPELEPRLNGTSLYTYLLEHDTYDGSVEDLTEAEFRLLRERVLQHAHIHYAKRLIGLPVSSLYQTYMERGFFHDYEINELQSLYRSEGTTTLETELAELLRLAIGYITSNPLVEHVATLLVYRYGALTVHACGKPKARPTNDRDEISFDLRSARSVRSIFSDAPYTFAPDDVFAGVCFVQRKPLYMYSRHFAQGCNATDFIYIYELLSQIRFSFGASSPHVRNSIVTPGIEITLVEPECAPERQHLQARQPAGRAKTLEECLENFFFTSQPPLQGGELESWYPSLRTVFGEASGIILQKAKRRVVELLRTQALQAAEMHAFASLYNRFTRPCYTPLRLDEPTRMESEQQLRRCPTSILPPTDVVCPFVRRQDYVGEGPYIAACKNFRVMVCVPEDSVTSSGGQTMTSSQLGRTTTSGVFQGVSFVVLDSLGRYISHKILPEYSKQLPNPLRRSRSAEGRDFRDRFMQIHREACSTEQKYDGVLSYSREQLRKAFEPFFAKVGHHDMCKEMQRIIDEAVLQDYIISSGVCCVAVVADSFSYATLRQSLETTLNYINMPLPEYMLVKDSDPGVVYFPNEYAKLPQGNPLLIDDLFFKRQSFAANIERVTLVDIPADVPRAIYNHRFWYYDDPSFLRNGGDFQTEELALNYRKAHVQAARQILLKNITMTAATPINSPFAVGVESLGHGMDPLSLCRSPTALQKRHEQYYRQAPRFSLQTLNEDKGINPIPQPAGFYSPGLSIKLTTPNKNTWSPDTAHPDGVIFGICAGRYFLDPLAAYASLSLGDRCPENVCSAPLIGLLSEFDRLPTLEYPPQTYKINTSSTFFGHFKATFGAITYYTLSLCAAMRAPDLNLIHAAPHYTYLLTLVPGLGSRKLLRIIDKIPLERFQRESLASATGLSSYLSTLTAIGRTLSLLRQANNSSEFLHLSDWLNKSIEQLEQTAARKAGEFATSAVNICGERYTQRSLEQRKKDPSTTLEVELSPPSFINSHASILLRSKARLQDIILELYMEDFVSTSYWASSDSIVQLFPGLNDSENHQEAVREALEPIVRKHDKLYEKISTTTTVSNILNAYVYWPLLECTESVPMMSGSELIRVPAGYSESLHRQFLLTAMIRSDQIMHNIRGKPLLQHFLDPDYTSPKAVLHVAALAQKHFETIASGTTITHDVMLSYPGMPYTLAYHTDDQSNITKALLTCIVVCHPSFRPSDYRHNIELASLRLSDVASYYRRETRSISLFRVRDNDEEESSDDNHDGTRKKPKSSDDLRVSLDKERGPVQSRDLVDLPYLDMLPIMRRQDVFLLTFLVYYIVAQTQAQTTDLSAELDFHRTTYHTDVIHAYRAAELSSIVTGKTDVEQPTRPFDAYVEKLNAVVKGAVWLMKCWYTVTKGSQGNVLQSQPLLYAEMVLEHPRSDDDCSTKVLAGMKEIANDNEEQENATRQFCTDLVESFVADWWSPQHANYIFEDISPSLGNLNKGIMTLLRSQRGRQMLRDDSASITSQVAFLLTLLAPYDSRFAQFVGVHALSSLQMTADHLLNLVNYYDEQYPTIRFSTDAKKFREYDPTVLFLSQAHETMLDIFSANRPMKVSYELPCAPTGNETARYRRVHVEKYRGMLGWVQCEMRDDAVERSSFTAYIDAIDFRMCTIYFRTHTMHDGHERRISDYLQQYHINTLMTRLAANVLADEQMRRRSTLPVNLPLAAVDLTDLHEILDTTTVFLQPISFAHTFSALYSSYSTFLRKIPFTETVGFDAESFCASLDRALVHACIADDSMAAQLQGFIPQQVSSRIHDYCLSKAFTPEMFQSLLQNPWPLICPDSNFPPELAQMAGGGVVTTILGRLAAAHEFPLIFYLISAHWDYISFMEIVSLMYSNRYAGNITHSSYSGIVREIESEYFLNISPNQIDEELAKRHTNTSRNPVLFTPDIHSTDKLRLSIYIPEGAGTEFKRLDFVVNEDRNRKPTYGTGDINYNALSDQLTIKQLQLTGEIRGFSNEHTFNSLGDIVRDFAQPIISLFNSIAQSAYFVTGPTPLETAREMVRREPKPSYRICIADLRKPNLYFINRLAWDGEVFDEDKLYLSADGVILVRRKRGKRYFIKARALSDITTWINQNVSRL
ncbi:hypothetical protein GMRT_15359 [Giardia muris]|uniref:Spt6 SH2 domain-containing protein n=1 Tax=Giardia muris TaxID=5742 RepID=A0A4Z1TDT8_GIAMU|nr:hypothetical protein GMRT_15359 [Giardia muris]|eukprot:TNJ30711.1 hypothetical protein GMRT_15359 [Giardia muris]